jgi:hypothetical protein
LGGLEAEEEMIQPLASAPNLRQNPEVAGMIQPGPSAACRHPTGARMGSVRFGSLLLLAAFLAACSDHPITIGRAYVAEPAPVRPLVETPPPAAVPIPPTPELKPGTELSADASGVSSGPSLERLRAEGDADAEFLVSSRTETPVLQSAETNSMSAPAPEAGVPDSGSTAADIATSAGNTGAASADADPQRLVGLSEADALRLLGKPKSRADTPPSRIWTYSSPGCDLRLFFYPEIGGTSYRTLTYEIDDRDPTDSNRRNCVGGLLKNHAS